MIDQTVSHYEIVGKLGEGGMGVVYKARDTRLRRFVAVKALLAEMSADAHSRQRFLQEAQAASALNHPHIITIHDIVRENGVDYIVMEYVEGRVLTELIPARGLAPRRALEYAVQIADAVAAAHAAGIIHRDVKPGNVIVRERHGVKVLDFGLAKLTALTPGESVETTVPPLTQAGALLGTLDYMSPEQALGEPVDARSDIFSLGAVLYEMLSGERPFQARGAASLLHHVAFGEPRPLTDLRPGLPPVVVPVVDKALAKKRDERYQTMAELASALRAVAATLVPPSQARGASAGAPTLTLPPDGAMAPTPASSGSQLAERRQVTVVYCELVGAGESSDTLGLETLFETIPELRVLAADVVGRFEGHLGTVLGHRLLAYFGYPQAHEDDARRAVHAALELVAEAARLGDSQAKELAVRVGIHTGQAVIQAGPGSQEEPTLGRTLDVAIGIQNVAAPGSVVVSARTRELVEGFFVVEPLAPARLAGADEPLSVYRVRKAEDVRVRIDSATLTPLVARERELDLLNHRWQLAKEGTGQVVLVSGETGIGKSRLVSTLNERLAAEAPSWLIAYGSPYARNSPFQPIIELLRQTLELAPSDSLQQQLTGLEKALRQRGFEPLEVVPLLAPMLSLSLDERYPSLGLSPEKQKQETLEAILMLLLEMAEQQPAVMVVEDLHWVDPSTLEFLGFLIDQVVAAPLLLVLTFRMEFENPWGNRAYLTQLSLNHLVGQEVETLIDRVTRGKALPPEIRRQIVDKTDGVPLFVEELTRSILESGLVIEREDDYELAEPLRPLAIPTTLRDSLAARLDRMGRAKEVAQLAAAIGREFSYQLLAAVAPLNEDDLRRELDRLVRAELIHRKGLSSRARYVFKHALIQDSAYASLLKSQRRRLHETIACALEDRFPDVAESQPELLAHHHTEAGHLARAADLWHRAGQRAFARSANLEAIDHFREGLGLVERRSPSAERDRQELSLQTGLGPALCAIRGYAAPDVRQAYERASSLAQQVGEIPERVSVSWGLYAFYLVEAEMSKALALAEELMDLAELHQDTNLRAHAHNAIGVALQWSGDVVAARPHLERAEALGVLRSRAYPIGHDVGVGNHFSLALGLWVLGYPQQSLQKMQETIALARQIDHAFSEVVALYHAAWLHQLRGEPEAVLGHVEELLPAAEERGFSYWQAHAELLQAWALSCLRRGDRNVPVTELKDGRSDEEILSVMRRNLDAYRATGARLSQPYLLVLYADACARWGRIDEGSAALEDARVVLETTGERLWEAYLKRLRGDLLLAGGKDARQAEEAFVEALETARRQQAKSLELRAATSLSRLWLAAGKKRQAAELLSEIYGWFTEGEETPALRDARALLEELS